MWQKINPAHLFPLTHPLLRDLEAALRAAAPQAQPVAQRYGYVLAMRLMQSDLFKTLDYEERAAIEFFVWPPGDKR